MTILSNPHQVSSCGTFADPLVDQEAFADLLGYHCTYVGGLERGERNLSLRAVERLAITLNVEPLSLITG